MNFFQKIGKFGFELHELRLEKRQN